MKWREQVSHMSVVALVLGTSSILLPPRPAAAKPSNHLLSLQVPDGFTACNDPSWFESRFAFARGGQQFTSPTVIKIVIVEDGTNGFVLNIAFLSVSHGTQFASHQGAYPAPAECTRVVSDAAEIAAQMMANKTPATLAIPSAIDHRIVISAPKHLIACDDPNQLEKWFELSRGPRRFGAPWSKSIEFGFDGDLDKGVMVSVLIREDTGRAILDANGQPMNDLRFWFNGPTECAKVIGYTANKLASFIKPPPKPIQSPPPPKSLPQQQKLNQTLGAGFVMVDEVVPNLTALGFQMSFTRMLHPKINFMAGIEVMNRAPVDSDIGRTRAQLTFLGMGSVAGCYALSVTYLCGQATIGAVALKGINVDLPKESWGAVIRLGPKMYIESPPFQEFKLRLEMGGFGNIGGIGLSGGDRPLSAPSYLSWSAGASLLTPL